ncbi:MAG: inorganic triphosphatase [Candidatus Binatia bacterium]
MEVEAKLLAGSRSVLDAIARRRRLGSYRLAPSSNQRLETFYLDTSRRDLLRRGIAVRVRRVGEACELTAKLPGEVDGDVHRRPESTVRLERMPPFPFQPSGSALARRIRGFSGQRALSPFLVTRIHRRALSVHPGRRKAPIAEIDLDAVELALPKGTKRGRKRRGRFFEVEVELKGGSEEDLGRIVEALRERHRLRASKQSKLERGLRWAGLAPRGASRPKSKKVTVSPFGERRARSAG